MPIALILLLAHGLAWGGEFFTVTKPARVYESPNRRAKIIHTLAVGDQVEVEPERIGLFKKARYWRGEESRVGYVSAYVARQWRGVEEDFEELGPRASERGSGGGAIARHGERRRDVSRIGFAGMGSFHMQFQRELQTNPETVYSISQFNGFTIFPGVIYEMMVGKEWALKFGALYRTMELTGDAKVQGSGIKSEFKLSHKFFGIQFGVINQPVKWGGLYMLGGIEYAHGLDTELEVVSGAEADTSGIEKKSYFILQAGLGYDMFVSGDFSVGPFATGGLMINSDPITLMLDGAVMVKYWF